jgi:ketosteroid isomerase-like protein
MSSDATEIFNRGFDALEAGDHDAALEAIRQGYELYNRDGMAAWLDILDPAIEWSEGQDAADSEVYRGHRGVLRQQQRFEEAWEWFRLEPEDYGASGETIVVVVNARARGRGSGVEVQARFAHVWQLRERRVVRWVVDTDPDRALREVGS